MLLECECWTSFSSVKKKTRSALIPKPLNPLHWSNSRKWLQSLPPAVTGRGQTLQRHRTTTKERKKPAQTDPIPSYPELHRSSHGNQHRHLGGPNPWGGGIWGQHRKIGKATPCHSDFSSESHLLPKEIMPLLQDHLSLSDLGSRDPYNSMFLKWGSVRLGQGVCAFICFVSFQW
jgi:hypothetical protein